MKTDSHTEREREEMSAITKLGTQIRLPDGREATVVYNSLVGVGAKFGLHNPPPEAFEGTDGNTVQDGRPVDFEWEPDFLLRKPEMSERLGMPCICEECEVKIIRNGNTQLTERRKEDDNVNEN